MLEDITNLAQSRPIIAGVTAVIAGSATLYGITRLFSKTRRVQSSVRLDGKTVLITGANVGIGRETAVDMATRGARVIMACRNPTKAQAAVSEVRRRSGNDNVVFRQVDTSDLNSVRSFAEQILREEDRLHILINNAGIYRVPYGVSPEGFDTVMATNHVGHFVLTLTLIDLLKQSAPSRIINVSSFGHKLLNQIDYTNKAAVGVPKMDTYRRSKLANVHFSKELARRLEGTGVATFALHPGAVYTSIFETGLRSIGIMWLYRLIQPLLWLFFLNERDGAQTTIYCAIDESISHLSGRYFANCQLALESDLGKDEGLARQLWAVSCEGTGIDPEILPSK